MLRNLVYLQLSLWKRLLGRGKRCPSCGFLGPTECVDRKWMITNLQRCKKCRLLFRTPTTTVTENRRIYQVLYREGFTTELPDDKTLEHLLATGFQGSQKDYSVYLRLLRAVGVSEGARIFDLGCSWGYGTFQLKQAGFDVEACEISQPRARFASDRLGIPIRQLEQMPAECCDVFFSAHVLEHVPCVAEVMRLSDSMLRPGGWFVAFTPNGSLDRRHREPNGWRKAWGFVHPQLLDKEWLETVVEGRLFIADTDPYDLQSLASGRSPAKWDGSELFFAIQKPLC